MQTPAVATKSFRSVCLECGTIKKSGKLSCCGRGGSWFGNCGSAGNSKLGHTWHEGIWACKTTQFQAAVAQQLHASHKRTNASTDDASMGMESKAVIVAAHMFASTPANTSTSLLGATPLPDSKSIIKPDRTSVAYENGTINSKAIAAVVTTIIHTAVDTVTQKPTIPLDNMSIIDPVNPTIIESMGSAFAPMHMTTPSHASASTSVTTREFGKLFHIITHIVMIVITVCSY